MVSCVEPSTQKTEIIWAQEFKASQDNKRVCLCLLPTERVSLDGGEWHGGVRIDRTVCTEVEELSVGKAWDWELNKFWTLVLAACGGSEAGWGDDCVARTSAVRRWKEQWRRGTAACLPSLWGLGVWGKACLLPDLPGGSFQRGWADTVTLPTVSSLCTWCFPEHWAGTSTALRGHQTGFHRTPQGPICQRELEKQYSSWFDEPAHTGARAEHNVMTLWDRMMLLVGDPACGHEEEQTPGKPFLARISNSELWWCIYYAKPIPPTPWGHRAGELVSVEPGYLPPPSPGYDW